MNRPLVNQWIYVTTGHIQIVTGNNVVLVRTKGMWLGYIFLLNCKYYVSTCGLDKGSQVPFTLSLAIAIPKSGFLVIAVLAKEMGYLLIP